MEHRKDRYSVLSLFHRLLLIISTVLFSFLARAYHLPHILVMFAYYKQCSDFKKINKKIPSAPSHLVVLKEAGLEKARTAGKYGGSR